MKPAYAVLAVGTTALALFVASYFGSSLTLTAVQLFLLGSVPLVLFATVLYALTRRFGSAAVRGAGVIGSVALVIVGTYLYSVARRPFQVGHDEFEPNLVFIFAPITLFVLTVVLSLAAFGWLWRQERSNKRVKLAARPS